jgi:hypothetical protein
MVNNNMGKESTVEIHKTVEADEVSLSPAG